MKKPLPASRHARLFAEPEAPGAASAHTAHIDGAARGNPGPASYGVVVRGPGGEVVAELKKYIGRATNNVAEYYALIAALDATSPGASSRGGSEAEPGALHREPQNPRRGARRIRAHYSRGVFLPDEPLELAEGTEVEIEIRAPIKT